MGLDDRAKALARIVVDYSTKIKKGESVMIQGERIASKFLEEIAKCVIDKGAYPVINTIYPGVKKHFLENADNDRLSRVLSSEIAMCKEIDVRIEVSAEEDPKCLGHVNPEKIALQKKANSKLTQIITGDGKEKKGKRWCVVGFPTIGDAKAAGMSLKKYSNIVYGATNIDWATASEDMKKVKDKLDNAKDIHIIVPGKTDLHLSLNGRGGQISNGKLNMPDGEVFYGPVEDSANGYITFSYPAIQDGNEVRGIRMGYRDGEAVRWSAAKNQAFLEAMLAIGGAKRIGELGIGCNYGIRRYMKNLLFDEKIGGTIHIALGDSYNYPINDGGGLNGSALHWDIVCELRKTRTEPGGELFVDGKLVQKDGKWQF